MRYLALLSGLCIIICSCGKPKEQPTDFRVDGISDVILQENGSQVLDLKVELLSSKSEQITLSLLNVPSGVSPALNIATEKAPFNTTLYIKDDSSKGGENTVTLKGVTATGLEHTYDFKLTTFAKSCAKKSSGLYSGTSTCRDGTGLIFSEMVFYIDSSDNTRLYFTLNQKQVYGIVNCNKNQLHIPLQSVGKYSIYGDGYLDKNYTIIDFGYTQRFSSGDTVSCNAHFVKK